MYSQGPNWKYVIIDSGYGSAPTRQQATTWTDEGLIYWHIYASLDLEEI